MSATKNRPDPDDIDLETTDSRVIIEVAARKREKLSNGQTFHTEGTYMKVRHLDKSIINLDAWFDPDYGHRLPNKRTRGDTTYLLDSSDITIKFDCFPAEIRAGARKRAAEDHSSTVRVLAGWLCQAAGSNDNLEKGAGSMFYTALKHELEATEGDPSWAITYDGDPDTHRSDEEDPITTLEEAKLYERGGWDFVRDHREHEDDDE